MWRYVLPPVLIVTILWIVMSAATTFYVHWIEQSYERTLVENVASNEAANDIGRLARHIDSLWPTDFSAVASSKPILELLIKEIECHERELMASAHSPDERMGIHKLSDLRTRLDVLLNSISASTDATSFEPLKTSTQIAEVANEIAAKATQLKAINDRIIADVAARRSIVSHTVFTARLLLLTAGPLIGVWLGWRLATKLHKTVARIAVTLQQSGTDEMNIGIVTLKSDGILGNVQQHAEALVARLQEAHRDLDRARAELVRSERLAAVGQLAAGVAHEIRNPLTSVKLLLQRAVRRPDKKDFDENELNLILEEIGRIESTIEGLFDFSCERPLRRTRHDLKGPIRRALNLIEGRARQQQVVLCVNEVEEPLFVNGDAEQLHQVFVNLFINAIEAMPNGGCLAISLSFPESLSYIQIQIHDTGNGIPKEILLHIFEPFATTKERGTGLGLAVSRRIIDQHGGSLVAQNAAEGGALFTIELPAAADQFSVHSGELVSTI